MLFKFIHLAVRVLSRATPSPGRRSILRITQVGSVHHGTSPILWWCSRRWMACFRQRRAIRDCEANLVSRKLSQQYQSFNTHASGQPSDTERFHHRVRRLYVRPPDPRFSSTLTLPLSLHPPQQVPSQPLLVTSVSRQRTISSDRLHLLRPATTNLVCSSLASSFGTHG